MSRSLKLFTVLLLLSAVSGCVQYSLVPAKQRVNVNDIQVTPSKDWNKSPVNLGGKTQLWTADGEGINRLIFVGGVADGESIFKSRNKSIPMPAFSAGMLPNDLEDLVKTSLKNLSGGEVRVNSSNLKPTKFGQDFGVRFNIDFFTPAGLLTKGDVLAAIKKEKLYLIIYTAASIHYYDYYLPEVEGIFASASL